MRRKGHSRAVLVPSLAGPTTSDQVDFGAVHTARCSRTCPIAVTRELLRSFEKGCSIAKEVFQEAWTRFGRRHSQILEFLEEQHRDCQIHDFGDEKTRIYSQTRTHSRRPDSSRETRCDRGSTEGIAPTSFLIIDKRSPSSFWHKILIRGSY